MLPITYSAAASRARRLRCPRCGEGPLFRNAFNMHEGCSHCGLKYVRGPGYFLGSTYINYGFISLTTTAAYVGLHFGADISNEILMPALVVYCLVVPVLLFRHARAWWLAMDCYCDPVSFDPENDDLVSGQRRAELFADQVQRDENSV